MPIVNGTEDELASSQAERFKDAAQSAECDEDEARWEAKLKRVVKHKPAGEKK